MCVVAFTICLSLLEQTRVRVFLPKIPPGKKRVQVREATFSHFVAIQKITKYKNRNWKQGIAWIQLYKYGTFASRVV